MNKLTKQKKYPVESCIVDLGASGEMLLEKILEEESIYGDDRARDNLSPQANDKRLLLGNGHGVHMTRI